MIKIAIDFLSIFGAKIDQKSIPKGIQQIDWLEDRFVIDLGSIWGAKNKQKSIPEAVPDSI